MGRPKLSEEEKKQRIRKQNAKWRAEHKKEISEYNKTYYSEHKEEIAEKNAKWIAEHPDYRKEYNKTPMGRAVHIASAYDRNDEKYNRGKCTITPIWIVGNIFPMPCHYCGAMGWEIMGCDRIDNSKPHTPENVVPCCRECNLKRQRKSYEEFKKEMEGI